MLIHHTIDSVRLSLFPYFFKQPSLLVFFYIFFI